MARENSSPVSTGFKHLPPITELHECFIEDTDIMQPYYSGFTDVQICYLPIIIQPPIHPIFVAPVGKMRQCLYESGTCTFHGSSIGGLSQIETLPSELVFKRSVALICRVIISLGETVAFQPACWYMAWNRVRVVSSPNLVWSVPQDNRKMACELIFVIEYLSTYLDCFLALSIRVSFKLLAMLFILVSSFKMLQCIPVTYSCEYT